jgi:hypothetical protein
MKLFSIGSTTENTMKLTAPYKPDAHVIAAKLATEIAHHNHSESSTLASRALAWTPLDHSIASTGTVHSRLMANHHTDSFTVGQCPASTCLGMAW